MQIIRQKKILHNVLFILFNSIITYEMDLSKAHMTNRKLIFSRQRLL